MISDLYNSLLATENAALVGILMHSLRGELRYPKLNVNIYSGNFEYIAPRGQKKSLFNGLETNPSQGQYVEKSLLNFS